MTDEFQCLKHFLINGAFLCRESHQRVSTNSSRNQPKKNRQNQKIPQSRRQNQHLQSHRQPMQGTNHHRIGISACLVRIRQRDPKEELRDKEGQSEVSSRQTRLECSFSVHSVSSQLLPHWRSSKWATKRFRGRILWISKFATASFW